jgi:single-stranded DNA-binding protein
MFHTMIAAGNLGRDPEMRYTGSDGSPSRISPWHATANSPMQPVRRLKRPSGSGYPYGASRPKPATSICTKAAKC